MRSFAQNNEFPERERTGTAWFSKVSQMPGFSQTVDFHPELARAARFMPRNPVTPWNIPIVRLLTRLQERRTPEGVEVLTLPSGVGIACTARPPEPATGAHCCGSTVAATSSAARRRMTRCAGVSPTNWASPWPR
ncbi:hypothetical protein MAUB1S_01962 [Mycolicibacterium aubagnense]